VSDVIYVYHHFPQPIRACVFWSQVKVSVSWSAPQMCWWNAFNLICGLNCRSDLIWISWTAVWSPLVKRAHKCIAFVSSCFNYAFMTEDRGELPASSYRPNYDAIGDDIVYSTIGVRQMKWTSVCLVSQLLVCMCQSFNETSGAVGLSGYVLKRHWFV